MSTRSLASLLIIAALVGCGKESATTDSASDTTVLPSANAPTISDEAAAEAAPKSDSPTTPPGTIEMPKGAVPPPESAKPATSDSEPKSGGIEMPAVDASAPPVVAQRPVIDEAPEATSALQLVTADLKTIQQKAMTGGKVCVVDFWSLSCEPCIKEFPGLVKLHHEFGDKVTCLSVDVDFDGRKSKPVESYRPRVTSFLTSVKAPFVNYLCETPNEEVYETLKIVSIPAVLVYDANGKLVRTFTDAGDDVGFTYEKDIVPLVKSLLAP